MTLGTLFFGSIVWTTLVLGILPMVFGRRYFHSWLFLGFAFSTCGWVVSVHQVVSLHSVLWVRFAFGFGASTAVFIALFLSYYPEGDKPKTKTLWFLIGAYVFFLGLIPTDLVVKSIQRSLHCVYGPFHLIYVLLLVSVLIVGLKTLFSKIRSHGGIEKRRLQYVLLGFSVPLVFVLITNILFPLFGNNQMSKFGPLFVPICVAIIFYSMIRHELLDVKIILKRSTLYTLLIGTLSAFLLTQLQIMSFFLEDVFRLNAWFSALGASVMVVLIYPRLRRFLDQLTDRLFFKGQVDLQAVLKRGSAALSAVRDRAELALILEKTIPEQTKLKSASLGFEQDGLLEGSDQAALLISIGAPKKLKAVWALGPKLSQDPFSREEILLFETLGHQASSALQIIAHTEGLEGRIDELQALYQEVSEAKVFTQEVLENLSSGVLTLDKNLTLLGMNKAAEMLLEIEAKETVNGSVLKIPALVSHVSLFQKTLARSKSYSAKFTVGSVDDPRQIALTTGILKNLPTHDIGLIVVVSDLTPLTLLERQIEHANRLASLGALAAGFAHEIRNPLMSIQSVGKLLQKHWDDPAFRAKFSNSVIPQVDRINGICGSLLALGRTKPAVMVETFILDPLKKAMDILTIDVDAVNVSVVLEEEATLPIMGDEQLLTQIFLNLLINASQALIEKKGRIVVRTAMVHGFAQVSITDDGCGMTKEGLKKLFEPFYTTKQKGTGLGLSLVYKMVHEHQGKISVSSKVGEGTTFNLFFPTPTHDLDRLAEDYKFA